MVKQQFATVQFVQNTKKWPFLPLKMIRRRTLGLINSDGIWARYIDIQRYDSNRHVITEPTSSEIGHQLINITICAQSCPFIAKELAYLFDNITI